MLKWFKKGQSNSSNNMEQVDVNGHLFRVFKNPLQAPQKRILAYFAAMHENQLGVTHEHLLAFFKMSEQAFNQKNFSRVIKLQGILESYVNLYAQSENLLRLAMPIVLLEGEPVDDLQDEYITKKKELCESSEDVRAFFLSIAWSSVSKSEQSKTLTELLDYLKDQKVKEVESIFLKSIRQFSPSEKSKS